MPGMSLSPGMGFACLSVSMYSSDARHLGHLHAGRL